ncbi:MAG: DUF559 domain-containing protein [Chitinivibrionales bacterium]|nr:DUF559 domain-containing protein [Chitinivibrionales bacterium]MBD3394593.1 DUF559 domain-containing protein [Chitinivibrionales bacterium]
MRPPVVYWFAVRPDLTGRTSSSCANRGGAMNNTAPPRAFLTRLGSLLPFPREGIEAESVPRDTADRILHQLLGKSRFRTYRFEAGRALGGTVVDYYCRKARLAVEIDRAGTRHAMRRKEEADKETALRGLGVKLLRFPEDIIIERPESVRNTILEELPA